MSSIVTCPHCQGAGFRSNGGDEEMCLLCQDGSTHRWGVSVGWLELPLAPRKATYIYENADRAETEDLVCQTWDREGEHWCNVCNLKGHQCRDCYQLECEGQERSYRTGILNRRMEHDC